MKKKSFILFFLIIILFQFKPSNSQNAWIRQDSLGNFSTIMTIAFINQYTGYFCALNYDFYKTTNGGLNWFKTYIQDSSRYRYLFTLGNNFLFLSDNQGYIIKSTDAGSTWQRQYVTTTAINSVYMSDYNTGFATTQNFSAYTSSVLKTTNGGLNWSTILNYNSSSTYLSVNGMNRDTVFACGVEAIYKSFNCGLSWESQYFYTTSLVTLLNSMSFINNSTGFACGYYYIYPNTTKFPYVLKTTNSGNNWYQKLLSSPPNAPPNNISFYDVNNGIIVGDSGLILRTTNSGLTWTRQMKIYQRLFSVGFANLNNIYVGGIYGILYKTTNGGWDIPNAPVLNYPENNAQNVNLSTTFDWQDVYFNAAAYRFQISTDSTFNNIVADIDMIDSSALPVTANLLIANSTYFWRVKSVNPVFSSSWSEIWKFNTNSPSPPVLITPQNNDSSVIPVPVFGWSTSYSSIYYKTQISRDSLFTQIILDTNTTGLYFVMPTNKLMWNTVYFWRVRGFNSAGGGNWSGIWRFKTTYSKPDLISPINNATDILYNTLFDWDNFVGANSYRLQFSLDSLFNSVAFDINYLTNSQYILKLNLVQYTQYFWRVCAITSSYSSFWSETRKFRTSALYTQIHKNEIIPSEFSFNIFPNPFNPKASVVFGLPKSENVKIILYNLLGQKTLELVNAKLLPGLYEIFINGGNLSSGVYFCKIVTDDFIKTQKLLLIK